MGFLGRNATVFQSEIYAIQKASEILRNMNTTSVTIFTDSQAALSVLAKVQIKSKVVKNCITELNKLGKSKVVDVKWIRSHSDFVANEEAMLKQRLEPREKMKRRFLHLLEWQSEKLKKPLKKPGTQDGKTVQSTGKPNNGFLSLTKPNQKD